MVMHKQPEAPDGFRRKISHHMLIVRRIGEITDIADLGDIGQLKGKVDEFEFIQKESIHEIIALIVNVIKEGNGFMYIPPGE